MPVESVPDSYANFLRQHGREVAQYEWSGFVMATLLVYLQERHGIDLMHSEYDDLARALTSERQATHFIFAESHKLVLLNQLKPQLLSEAELRDFFNEFNDASDDQVGTAMLDGVIALQECMSQVDDQCVIVFSIAWGSR